MIKRISIIMVTWAVLPCVTAIADSGDNNVHVAGSVSRGDGFTLADDRTIWLEVRDATGQVMTLVPSTDGTYSWDAPPGFAGSISPIHPDITFEPILISYANLSNGQGGISNLNEKNRPGFTAFYTYHVDKDGVSGVVGNDQNAGTSTTPLASIQEAVDRAMPGDTVIIRGATYTQDNFPPNVEVAPVVKAVRSGTMNHPITIRAFDAVREPVILDAENDRLKAFEVRNLEHITVDGIIARRSKHEGFYVDDSENIVIRNCFTSDNIIGNKSGFVLIGRCRNCLIERCVSTRNGRGFLMTGTVETSDPSQDHRPRFNTIRRCLAFGNIRDEEDSDGFQILAGNDNVIDRSLAFDNGDDGFDFTRGSHRNRLTNCVSFAHPHAIGGNGDGNGFKIGVWGQAPPDSQGGAANCEIRNCVAFGNKAGLVDNAVGLGVYNCQFNHNRRFGIVFDESTGHDARAVLYNNVVFGNGENEPSGRDIFHNIVPNNPIEVSDFNYIGDGSSTNDHPDESGHESHSIFGTIHGPPGLVNANNAGVIIDVDAPDFPFANGYRLTPDSVLIDAGLSVSQEYPAVEFPEIEPNIGFPGANVYDIGVYEFLSEDPDVEFLIQCQQDCDCVLGPVAQAHGSQIPSDMIDICNYQFCDTDGFCSSCSRSYGNHCGSLNSTVQTNDILCAVVGFGDYCSCPNADIWDSDSPGCDPVFSPELCKGPSGLPLNTDDIIAAVSAFGGDNPFNCSENSELEACDNLDIPSSEACAGSTQIEGTNASGNSDPGSSGELTESAGVLTLVPRERIVLAGSTVVVDVFLSGQNHLKAYQTGLVVSGGISGNLEMTNVDVYSDRSDHVFTGYEQFTARDLTEFRAAGVLLGNSIDVPSDESAYLATFTMRPSPDARGVFMIRMNHEHTSLWTTSQESLPPFSASDSFVTIVVPLNDPR